MITTSEFKKSGHSRHAVAICQGVPPDFTGRHYLKLAPTKEMLKNFRADQDTARFVRDYTEQILEKLDAHEIIQDLGPDAILLCWEPRNYQCHRRLVAEWLEKNLRIEVPEIGQQRRDTKAFVDLPVKPPRWPARPKKVKPEPSTGLKFDANPFATLGPSNPGDGVIGKCAGVSVDDEIATEAFVDEHGNDVTGKAKKILASKTRTK